MTHASPAIPALRADDVWKSFGAREVLRGVSVSLRAHDVVALIGASGSGKSTLLRCLGLLEPIDDGRIFLGAEDISDPRVDGNRVRARLGAVFQSYNLFPHLSVLGNVTLASRIVHKVPKKDAEERAMALLERVGLASFMSSSRPPVGRA
ncbi:MAG: ATP-binding cassette domain-containing protein [Microbacterium sp.]